MPGELEGTAAEQVADIETPIGLRGRRALLMGAPAQALESIKPSLDQRPDDPNLLTVRAASRDMLKDLPGAQVDAERVVPGERQMGVDFEPGDADHREGDGDDAKITVNFPRFGLKKLIEKYAGLKRD